MINLTENQKKVTEYGKGNLLVSASAGSGKTTVMIERIVRLICEEGASVKRMLVTTFTTAAADAIAGRLTGAITERLHAASGKEKERLEKELEYLPCASIGTLHSWCQRIIRKYFYETDDDPSFAILEPGEYSLMMSNAVKDTIEEALEQKDPVFLSVYESYLFGRGSERLKEDVLRIMWFLENTVDPEKFLENSILCYDDPAIKDAFDRNKEDLKNRISDEIDRLEIGMASEGAVPAELAAAMISELRWALNWEKVSFTSKSTKMGIWGEERNRIKTLIEKKYSPIIATEAQMDTEECRKTAGVLASLAFVTLKRISAKKADNGVLTFSDLEHRALKILSGPSGEEVRNSYDYVFIDEFQDINPVQNEIIEKLGNNNMFFVGDVKQSIYGFRGCVSTAFSTKRLEYAAEGSVIDLNSNFRSKPGILKFCNDVFSRAMTEEFGGTDYSRNGAFDIGPGLPDMSCVEVLTYEKKKKKQPAGGSSGLYSVKKHALEVEQQKRDVEAELVTERIKSMTEAGTDPGDIVILVRKRSGSPVNLMKLLRMEGYAVSLNGKMTITDNNSVKNLLSYLKVVDNFKDDISLFGAMRSFYGGFTDREIAEITSRFPKRKYFFEAVRKYASAENDDIAKRIKTFSDEVAGYSALSQTMSVSGLLGKITAEKKVFTHALAEDDGLNNSAFLGFLMDYSEQFSGRLSEFIQSLEEAAPEMETVTSSGTIRIETVHASKGLEYPVVIVYGSESAFNSGSYNGGSHIALRDDAMFSGIALEIDSPDGKEYIKKSYPLEYAKRLKKTEETEEEMRLLYVAMTRARKKLIITLAENEKAETKDSSDATRWADWIRPAAGEAFPENDEIVLPDETGIEDAAENETPDYSRLVPVICSGIPRGKEIKRSVTKMLKNEEEPSENGEQWKSITAAEYESCGAMERGTAFHKALELYDYTKTFEEQEEYLSQNVPMYDNVEPDILKKAAENIKKEIAGRKIYREKDFLCPSEDNPGTDDGTLIQGVIDLLIVGAENEIVDYKTGMVNDERKIKYQKQLELYKKAVEKITGMEIHRTRIYLIDSGCFMED